MKFFDFRVLVNFCKHKVVQTQIWPENCTFHLGWSKKSTGNKIQAENGEEQKGHSGRFFNLNFLYIFQYHILCMFMLILANQIGFYFIFELFTCNSSC